MWPREIKLDLLQQRPAKVDSLVRPSSALLMLCEWLAITNYNFHTSMAQKPTPHCLHRDNGCALLEEKVSADVIEGGGKNA